MKYDFNTFIDRKGKDSIAFDYIPFQEGPVRGEFNKIPMWIADMNFATAPSVTKALMDRISQPTFGYFVPSKAYYDSIMDWQLKRNGYKDLKRKYIGYQGGVLGGIASAVQALTTPGDAILFHFPAYNGFLKVMEENERRMIFSPLKRDEKGIWRIDYEDMDLKLKKYKIHLAVFCSPHNPTGRVWEREEIEKVMEVYKRNDCFVIWDEIWADLILDGNKHIPIQTVSEDAKKRVISFYAPTKTFNLAGLVGAYHIIYNYYLRDRIRAQSKTSHYNTMNVFSMHALIGAYQPEGHEWVNELCQVLSENVFYAYEFMKSHFNGIRMARPQGTYLLYLDCSEWPREKNMTLEELIKRGISVGVIWQDGREFFTDNTIRLNLALPKELVVEAMQRLEKYVFI